MFGVLSVVVIKFVHPSILSVVDKINDTVLGLFVILATCLTILDFVITVQALNSLTAKLDVFSNIVDDMKRDNEVKDIQIDEQRRMSEIKMEQEYKKTQLPSQCPFCKAPTTGSLVCEYCNSKIM